jgi:DNA repair protein RecO
VAAVFFFPYRYANDRVFRLLLAVLRAIKRTGEVNRPLIYFNYWLLHLGGFLPDFGVCASCGAVIETAGYYVTGAHGLACGDCQSPRDSFRLSVSDLKAVVESCQGTLERWIQAGAPASGLNEVRRFLEELIESQLERKMVTRELLAEDH